MASCNRVRGYLQAKETTIKVCLNALPIWQTSECDGYKTTRQVLGNGLDILDVCA